MFIDIGSGDTNVNCVAHTISSGVSLAFNKYAHANAPDSSLLPIQGLEMLEPGLTGVRYTRVRDLCDRHAFSYTFGSTTYDI